MFVLAVAVSHSPANEVTSRPHESWLKKRGWPDNNNNNDNNNIMSHDNNNNNESWLKKCGWPDNNNNNDNNNIMSHDNNNNNESWLKKCGWPDIDKIRVILVTLMMMMKGRKQIKELGRFESVRITLTPWA